MDVFLIHNGTLGCLDRDVKYWNIRKYRHKDIGIPVDLFILF